MRREDNGFVSIILGAGPDPILAESAMFDAMAICQSGKAKAPSVRSNNEKKEREKKKQVKNMVIHVN
jgi:hypothetical protein